MLQSQFLVPKCYGKPAMTVTLNVLYPRAVQYKRPFSAMHVCVNYYLCCIFGNLLEGLRHKDGGAR